MIFLELFSVFFLISLFTIGGGYAMLPMIIDQVVGRGWLSFEALNNFIAIAESTPGPFAVNTATLVGFKMGARFGFIGSLFGATITTLGVVLPSFIIILMIAKNYDKFISIKWVKKALKGIQAIVIGLILAVVVELFKTNIFGTSENISFDYLALIIVALIFSISLIYKKVNPIFLIVLSGFLGVMFYYVF